MINKLIRWLTGLIFLIIALVFYTRGVAVGGTLFLLLGLIFEFLFWRKLFAKEKS